MYIYIYIYIYIHIYINNREWIRMGCREFSDAKVAISGHLYPSLCVEAVQALAQSKLGGLAQVGPGVDRDARMKHIGSGSPQAARGSDAFEVTLQL